MLADAGGTIADKTGPEKGGAVRCWVGRGTWVYIQKVNKVSATLLDNWGNGGANFTRTVAFDKLAGVMTSAQVEGQRAAGLLVELADKTGFTLRAAPADENKDAPLPKQVEAAPQAVAPGELHTDIEAMRGVEVLGTCLRHAGRQGGARVAGRRDEMKAISGSRALLTNIVVTWNTARMHEVVERLKRDGTLVEDDWLRRIGPAHWGEVDNSCQTAQDCA